MNPRSAQALRFALLVLLGVASVWAFGWECSTRRRDPVGAPGASPRNSGTKLAGFGPESR